ncbi:MAG: 50S ribosomal protein L11 methyltransferase [Firmicutes bacterium]|nr:50S ribosomal protein L11 methyltransferase [Candidatus Colimorpha enterica]
MSQWTQLKVKCRTEDLEIVSSVMSMLDNGLMIEDATEIDRMETIYGELIDEKVMNADRTKGAVSIFVPEERNIMEYSAFLDAHLASVPHETEYIGLNEEDWADSWKKYYKPVRIGDRLIVVPTWEKYDPMPDDIILSMDPGMAFGTGTHETTRICSRLLEQYMEKGDTVLDVGTGSGILAIAASKLGAKKVNAYDIDPVAVRIAKENCDVNGCQNIKCGISDLLKNIDRTEKYDFICANIVADIIVRMAPDISGVLADDGLIAVSGVIDTQRERVLDALTSNGLKTVAEVKDNDWCGLLLTKK